MQQHVEKALSTILRQDQSIVGASRTDSGVHAKGQIAIFDAPNPADSAAKLMLGLNAVLHDDIKVMGLRAVAHDFHPIRAAIGKRYAYRIWMGRFSSPFLAPYCWATSFDLDVGMMSEEARFFEGEQDFAAFCAADSSAKTTVRNVRSVNVVQEDRLLTIEIVGTGFLKQMCRSMVGTLLDVGRGKLEPGAVRRILNSRDHTKAGQTAPALGLSLENVIYLENGQQKVSGSGLSIDF